MVLTSFYFLVKSHRYVNLWYNVNEGDGFMSKKEKKSLAQKALDIYWITKKRSRQLFWIGTIVLTVAMGIFIYLQTSSFDNVWIAFLIGPGIMLLTLLGLKIQRFEDKHDLTHHKSYNGKYIHTTFPIRRNQKGKK